MLEEFKSGNGEQSPVKSVESFVAAIKTVEIKEDLNSPLAEKNVKKRKEEDRLQIEKLMQEFKGPATKKEVLIAEKEIPTEEIARRIVDEKDVEEIGRKQQEKIDRYNVGPEELAILTWEDKATAAQKDINEMNGYLALSEEDFTKRYGPDLEAVREMKEEIIPRLLAQKTKILNESKEIANGLRKEKEGK